MCSPLFTFLALEVTTFKDVQPNWETEGQAFLQEIKYNRECQIQVGLTIKAKISEHNFS